MSAVKSVCTTWGWTLVPGPGGASSIRCLTVSMWAPMWVSETLTLSRWLLFLNALCSSISSSASISGERPLLKYLPGYSCNGCCGKLCQDNHSFNVCLFLFFKSNHIDLVLLLHLENTFTLCWPWKNGFGTGVLECMSTSCCCTAYLQFRCLFTTLCSFQWRSPTFHTQGFLVKAELCGVGWWPSKLWVND